MEYSVLIIWIQTNSNTHTLEVMTVNVQALVASDQVKTNDQSGVTTHWIISVESGAKWRSVAASAGSLYTEYLPS